MHEPMNTIRLASVLGLALTCSTSALRAEAITTDDATSQELLPYVVVATRTPIELDRVSPSVSYISAEEIEFWQDRSLVDSLTRQTGLAFKSNGAPGSLTSLFVRGTNSDQTGFFLDGRRLNPGFGNQFNLETLDIGNLSSVQVQRGASSVNYGSNGIGGVVDLQTQSNIGEDAHVGSVMGEVGFHQYARGAAAGSITFESWGVSFGASTLTTDNDRPNDTYENHSFNSRYDYKIADGLYFELVTLYSNSDKDVPGNQSSPTYRDNQENQNWLISPGVRYTTDKISMHAFYSRTSSELKNDIEDSSGDIYMTRTEVESDEVNLQVDYTATDELLLTAGTVYRNDGAYDPNLNAYDSDLPVGKYENNAGQTGVWSQAQWRISDAFEVRGGARFDSYTDYDNSTNGSIEVIYFAKDINLSVFAKVASSYSPPSALDSAYDEDFDSGKNPSNTILNPEESVSYEFGVRQTFLEDTLEYSVVLFHNDIDNLIVYESFNAPDFSDFWSDTYNVGEATTEGVELMVKYAVSEQMNLGLNYTYLTAEDDDADQRLAYRPRHLLQLTATYQPIDSVTIGFSGVGQFDRERNVWGNANEGIEDFFVVDLFADWIVTERLTLFTRVNNALNENYESTYDYPALGSTGYIGARLSF